MKLPAHLRVLFRLVGVRVHVTRRVGARGFNRVESSSFHGNPIALGDGGFVLPALLRVSDATLEDGHRHVREVVAYVILQLHAGIVGDEEDVRVVRPRVNVPLNLVELVSVGTELGEQRHQVGHGLERMPVDRQHIDVRVEHTLLKPSVKRTPYVHVYTEIRR